MRFYFAIPRSHEPRPGRAAGFTLIEILVVIAILAILAGLVVSLAPAAAEKKIRSRAQALISELDLAIGSYRADLGFLPPDNPGNPKRPPLYYELKGSVADPTSTRFTMADNHFVVTAQLQTAFGIDGFANAAGSDAEVKDFYKSLTPKSYQEDSGIRYLVIPVPGPDGDFNPVRYNASSTDRVNLDSYDLWVDVMIGGKAVKIGNWK